MASYDSPGYRPVLPGWHAFDPHEDAQTAPGSTGIQAVEHSGPVLGEASGTAAFGPGSPSPVAGLPSVPVGLGDSNSFSDGIAAHSSAIDGNAGADGQYMDSGAGHGSDIPDHNPSSMWRGRP